MSHALIVEHNRLIGRAVEDRLLPLGFDSFDHRWTEPQAIEAARVRAPDLVVIGETGPGGSCGGLARAMLAEHGAPVILIEHVSCVLYRIEGDGISTSREFRLSDIDSAAALASGAAFELAA